MSNRVIQDGIPPSIATERRWIGSSCSTRDSNVLRGGSTAFDGGGVRVRSGVIVALGDALDPKPNMVGDAMRMKSR